jgi:hypothetical protein
MDEVLRWHAAYEPLFKSFQTPSRKSSLGFLGSTTLKIHAIVTKIMLTGSFFDSEIGYDALLPDFQLINSLVESIYDPLSRPSKTKSPTTSTRQCSPHSSCCSPAAATACYDGPPSGS